MSDFKKGDRERFISKFQRGEDDECWEWEASRSSEGYGSFYFSGRMVGAHRFAMMLQLGEELPRGICVLHHCDNPPCVNPWHLFLGSRADNTNDAKQKGRLSPPPRPDNRGEAHGQAAVTEDVVRAIREEYDALPLSLGGLRKKKGAGLEELISKYGVPKSTFLMIATRKTWRHVV